jgi:predicted Zn-dependent protease
MGMARSKICTTAPAVALILLATCARNPVTGRNELSLVSESQEIEMGKQATAQVQQTIGYYNDPAIQSYVDGIGKTLAAKTERPNLPWEFHVVDDPAVNAFAIPGGFIFITRGLMTAVTNEAELATVIGHETGHVAARHSVQDISKQQVAQLGLGIGSILSPTVAKYGAIASQGLGLLFLKYSRQHEAQADELGFKYALADGYDVRQMANVFQTLERVSQMSGGGKLPQWLQTHPDPENRIKATEARLAKLPPGALNGKKVDRDAYLQRTQGMVYGNNPRQGYFKGSTFYHPDLKFQIDFPQGWKTQNGVDAVVAVSPNQDAAVQLSLAPNMSPTQAAQAFFSQQGLQSSQVGQTTINGFSAVQGYFDAQTSQGAVRGLAVFLSYGNATYQIMGYSPTSAFPSHEAEIRRTAGSFRPLTDPAALNVQPAKIELVRLPRAMTIEQFNQQYPSTVSIDEVALINEVDKTTTMPAGQLVKRVVGGTAGQ